MYAYVGTRPGFATWLAEHPEVGPGEAKFIDRAQKIERLTPPITLVVGDKASPVTVAEVTAAVDAANGGA